MKGAFLHNNYAFKYFYITSVLHKLVYREHVWRCMWVDCLNWYLAIELVRGASVYTGWNVFTSDYLAVWASYRTFPSSILIMPNFLPRIITIHFTHKTLHHQPLFMRYSFVCVAVLECFKPKGGRGHDGMEPLLLQSMGFLHRQEKRLVLPNATHTHTHQEKKCVANLGTLFFWVHFYKIYSVRRLSVGALDNWNDVIALAQRRGRRRCEVLRRCLM